MPRFIHKRTGKVIEASDRDAHRYRGSNFEPVADAPARAAKPATRQSFEVPDGTVVEVLDWAGDDPARRAAALEAEQAGKNRKGLLSALSS